MLRNKNRKYPTPEDLGLTDDDLARLSKMFSPDDFISDGKPDNSAPDDFPE